DVRIGIYGVGAVAGIRRKDALTVRPDGASGRNGNVAGGTGVLDLSVDAAIGNVETGIADPAGAGLNGDVVGTGARLIGEDARLTGGGKGVTGDGACEVDADRAGARPRIDPVASAPAIKVAGESPVAIDDDGAAGRRRANGVVLCFDEAI